MYLFYFLLTNIRAEFGEVAILILILSCIFSDVGGYVVGKLIGGPKLTNLSPNKTISGAFGSVIFTVLGTYLFILILNEIEKNQLVTEVSINLFWLILMSIICQIGDLFLTPKRKANLKDTKYSPRTWRNFRSCRWYYTCNTIWSPDVSFLIYKIMKKNCNIGIYSSIGKHYYKLLIRTKKNLI